MVIDKLKVLNIEHLKIKAKDDSKNENGNIKNNVIKARKILKILERDNFMCVKCGRTDMLTIDHIHGRSFAKWNNAKKYRLNECQTLCEECHLEKNRKEVELRNNKNE